MTTESSDRTRGPRRLNAAVWLLLPVLILTALELTIRRSGLVKSSWSRVERIAAEQKIDFLFLGTSRTWAAVNEDVFQDEVARITGRAVRAVRAGIGNSTNAQHVRGIRNLVRSRPRALEGTVVLIESREGIPGSERGADLRNELGPGALDDVFRLEDVPALLAADLDAESKAETLVAWAAPPLRFLEHRGRFRRKLLEKGSRTLGRSGLFASPPESRPARLAEGGGIRTDAAGIEAVRALVGERYQAIIDAQRPFPWGEHDLLAMVDRLQAAGAVVVLLDIPLCSRERLRWGSRVRKADAERVAPLLAERGVATVTVPLSFADASFPDNLHLDLESAEAFSRGLATEWVGRGSEPGTDEPR